MYRKILNILIIFFCLFFQFSGCTNSHQEIKERNITYPLKTPAYSQIPEGEEEPFSINSEGLLTDVSEPGDQLTSLEAFSKLRFLTSSNSIEEFTEYAGILHNIAGKGVLHTDFPIIINSPVKESIHYFQREKNFMRKALIQSGAYIPLMKPIFKKNGLPEDLAFLALIESGFNPYAYSRAGACGPWQFIKSTAKRYGLQVDLWVDERRDPVKSTQAAVEYLKDLHSKFGDWYLAVTAYNAGEQKVVTAIKRYKTTNYWVLRKKRYLKIESRNFVPKLLAAILIGKNPEEYGFRGLKFQKPVPLSSVHIPNPTDLKFIAKMTSISLSELKRFNPELRKWCTPPSRGGYWIKIPASKKGIFAQNFSRNKKKFFTRRVFHKHRIRRGETLYEIARHYNTKVVHIQKINGIRNPRLIYPGRILIIPIPPIVSSS